MAMMSHTGVGHGAKVNRNLAVSILGVVLCRRWWGLLSRFLGLLGTIALLGSGELFAQ